jgi:hypothetical protein
MSSLIQSGNFTATGNAETLVLRSDVDVLEVFNYTAANAGIAVNTAIKYTWYRGMAANEGLFEGYNAAGGVGAWFAGTASGLGVGGFTLVDSSVQTPSAAIAVAAGTNATQPVYDTANTLGMGTGSIVRIQNTAHTDLNGLDFTVDNVVNNVSFRLANTLQQAPGAIAGAAGTYRRIYYDPIFYPRHRVISNITQADQAVVTTLVDHGYTVGQVVRFSVPAECGMVELDGLSGVITAVTAAGVHPCTFTVNINTAGFTAFTFPLIAAVPCNFAVVKPVGEDSTVAPNVLADATENQGYIGIQLAAGAQSPAGVIGNVIYWKAYKSFNL